MIPDVSKTLKHTLSACIFLSYCFILVFDTEGQVLFWYLHSKSIKRYKLQSKH